MRRSTPEEVASYYRDVTDEYEAYGGAARAWNYGVWERGVATLQGAFERGREWLLRGIEVDASTRLLDVGCGVGGFAIWCAKRFGNPVTGITLCAEHVSMAQANAAEAGVTHLCDFREMDMDALAFESEGFDVVVNQETFCCAADKRRYVGEVFRVLTPGGAWSCIDYNVKTGKPTAAEQEEIEKVLAGFHLPSLISLKRMQGYLDRAGFEGSPVEDLTPFVLPSAELVMRRCYEPLRVARQHPRRHIHSPDLGEEKNVRGHYEAGMAYAIGLHTGLFQHGCFRVQRPGSR